MPGCAAGACAPNKCGGGGAIGGQQEAIWPTADVVVGNPPFLGDRKMIRELGEGYTTTLRNVYAGRVPGGADLVCYWFDKARAQITAGALQRAGLVSTNSIRGGANRKVLDAICVETRIFDAWSDEPWVNEGAAVGVSLIAFGCAEPSTYLDGARVNSIAADLSAHANLGGSDLTKARKLNQNHRASFQGVLQVGDFDISGSLARSWLQLPNPHGKPSSAVLRPGINGLDLVRRNRDVWLIDFGPTMAEGEAAFFEIPFQYVVGAIKPVRSSVRREAHRKYWWRFGDARPALRDALKSIPRYIATPLVAKHVLFVWVPSASLVYSATPAITRADDTTFGILHSRFHELWSLRLGTSLEDRPRYTPTTCFETFPFPAGLTPADTAHQRTEALDGGALIPAGLGAEFLEENRPLAQNIRAQEAIKREANDALRAHAMAIAQAAHRLDGLRRNWLNPPEWTHRVPEVVPLGMDTSPYPDRIEPKPGLSEADARALAQRTLTKLYNQRPAWLAQAHAQLNAAVAAAYGWADYTPELQDDEILRRLLALNLQRAAGGDT